jgi:hypothetical protein
VRAARRAVLAYKRNNYDKDALESDVFSLTTLDLERSAHSDLRNVLADPEGEQAKSTKQ